MPALLFQYIALVVPAAFLAGLKGHANVGYFALIIYFFFHVSSTASAYDLSEKDRRYRIITSVIFQSLFVFVTFWISTCWIVSLSTFLPLSSHHVLPTYVWPNASRPFQQWTVASNASTIDFEWARCNSSSSPRSLSLNVSAFHGTTVASTWNPNGAFMLIDRVRLFEFCLTDIAAFLYLLFVCSGFLISIYCVLLIVFMKIIDKRCFRKKTSRANADVIVLPDLV